MADLVTEISSLMGLVIIHLGAAAPGGTDVTVGLLAVAGALVGLTFSFVRRIR